MFFFCSSGASVFFSLSISLSLPSLPRPFFPFSLPLSLSTPSFPPPRSSAVPKLTDSNNDECVDCFFFEACYYKMCGEKKQKQKNQLSLSLSRSRAQGCCCCPCCCSPAPAPSPPPSAPPASATGTYMNREGRAWFAACPGVIIASAAAVVVAGGGSGGSWAAGPAPPLSEDKGKRVSEAFYFEK